MKKALVTGGSRGLGLAICRRLLEGGWKVVTTSRAMTSELRSMMSVANGRLEHVTVDFSKSDDVNRFLQHPGFLHGYDGFVANAAVGTEGLLTLTSEESVRHCIEVNLVAPILVARQVIKGMLDKGGSLVFVSSVAAWTGLAGLSVYSATKGALVAFSRALAREYGERGIRSNSVLPGFMATDMTATLDPEQQNRVARRAALKRIGTVEEVANVVCFLLSDEARFVTGTEVVVDGGFTA
ncbi:MAG: SDR family oxidoreductase [Verrucomicrobiae bacterium]|nr:SDR family oxidoreductase [Verrucomicrobiae bacterium]